MLKLDKNLHTILQILSVTLFGKAPILQVLANIDCVNAAPVYSKHLTLFE